MTTKTTRLLIVDTHPIVRMGMKKIIEETSDFPVVYEATTAQELIETLNKETVDIIIMEILLPGSDTFETIKKIKQQFPQIQIMIFTDKAEELYALRLIRAGVSAYITKETDIEVLFEILKKVANGKKHITAIQSELLAEAFIEPNLTDAPLHEQLSDREFQVLYMLASGLRKAAIAEKLQLSTNTVGNHRSNILKKMKAKSNSDLTRYAILNGIVR